MVINAVAFYALLHSLSLTQGSYKPAPTSFGLGDSSRFPSYSTIKSPPAAQVLLDTAKKSPHSPDSQDECYIEPYDTPIEKQDFPPFDPKMATIYRYRQQQSVNLGSWFVHENWMTPSLLKCAGGKKLSELDIASGWGSKKSARSLLEHHWDTFITRADFEYLAKIGINTVRLPIGYWNLGPSFTKDTPFDAVGEVYKNSWPRIVRAINDAAECGIGVLVDLHGAVGSQNGQPHSGISDGASGMFDNPQFMEKTIDVLVFLAEQLVNVTNVVGIQLLNEPQNKPELVDFYIKAIESMRSATLDSTSFPLYLHDGFDLDRFSQFAANRTDFVVEDHHSYFVFTPSDQNKPASQHTSNVKGPISQYFASASSKERRNLIIGEWSCALTHESTANEDDPDQAQREFCSGQMDVYANVTAGWSFWSYTKEGCEDDVGWCFKRAVNNSLPATFFPFDNTPTNSRRAKEYSSLIANMTAPSASEILGDQANGNESDTSGEKKTHTRRFESLMKGKRRSLDRFDAIYRRHQPDGAPLTPAQQSTVKGYTNGFRAATEFASLAYAKLGFTGQYVADDWPEDLEPGTEQIYRDGFGNGLMEGQRRVQMALNGAH